MQHPPHHNLQAGAQPNAAHACSSARLFPKSTVKSRWFAGGKAGSEGREHHWVIACKLNLACKREPHRRALNRAVSCAGCSCHSPCIPSDTREGMWTEGVFEIHTSKLITERPGLYLLHNWRQVREQNGEQGDESSHSQRL